MASAWAGGVFTHWQAGDLLPHRAATLEPLRIMNQRKNQASLSAAEKQAFVNALLALKNQVPSQLGLSNRYDDYVQIHVDSMATMPGWAHRGPAFGPWHRIMLRNLELDLQAVDPTVSLPYWDWSVDTSSGAGPGSPWADDFMGAMTPNTEVVTTGPFRANHQWPLNIREPGDNRTSLTRALGRTQFQTSQEQAATLPTPANVQGALQETPYDRAPWNAGAKPGFRDRLEGFHGPGSLHNRVHLWVGGAMTPSTSPNDPIFFLRHCNVDRLWAEWQRLHPAEPYVPAANAAGAPVGHRLTDPMQPWGGAVTVQSALQHQALGYYYDTEPPPPGPGGIVPFLNLPFGPQGLTHLPRWQRPAAHGGHGGHHVGPMFVLSPEDIKAGGHDTGA
jgi:tyrosinase